MTILLAPLPIQSFRDNNGNPLAGGLLYTYQAGTSTLQSTYTDATGTTPNANPVVLNSRGEASVWLTSAQAFKLVLQDSYGVLIWSVDQVASSASSGSNSDISSLSGLTTALSVPQGGTGAITPVLALLALGAAASGANADITSLAGIATVNAAPLLHLNDIINGDFRIANIGTGFAAAVNGAYDLDGWVNGNNTTAVFGVSQAAGSTAGRLARQVTISTAKTTVAASDYVIDETRIEGFNIEKYIGNTFTVAFRARVPVAGIHCVYLKNAGADRTFVAEINFTAANVYQNCSLTVVGGLPSSGSWNYTNGIGLYAGFTHMAGTAYQTTPGAWSTGNFFSTVNQVNDCATVSNAWALEKVTMNLGTVAAVGETSFEAEMVRCMRYCEPMGIIRLEAYGNGGNVFNAFKPFKVLKRSAPTLTGQSATSNVNCSIGTGSADVYEVIFPITVTAANAFVAQIAGTIASARL